MVADQGLVSARPQPGRNQAAGDIYLRLYFTEQVYNF